MATTLTATVKATISALYQNALEFGSAEQTTKYNVEIPFADGAGINQATLLWTDQRTLAASGTENLDLAAVLTNAFGTAITFASVKAILVKAAAGNTNDVVLGGAGSNAFLLFGDATDTIAVKPGGCFLICAPGATGYAVTAATGDILKVTNSSSGTGVTYDIIIIGD